MTEEKLDKVSFYIRSDFGEKDVIEYRWIMRGDSCGLATLYCKVYANA